MTETKRAFNKVIRNTICDFEVYDNHVDSISYVGLPNVKGFEAVNLLDEDSVVRHEGRELSDMTTDEFLNKVEKCLMPYETELEVLSRSFDLNILHAKAHFRKNTYEYEITMSQKYVMNIEDGVKFFICDRDFILKHFTATDTAFYKIVKSVEHNCWINLSTQRVAYRVHDAETGEYKQYMAQFDAEGNVDQFKRVDLSVNV